MIADIMFSIIDFSSRTSTASWASWWCWLCELFTWQHLSCENLTGALIAQTLIHIMFSLNFFQDIYSKLVTLALCAFHMTASCENRTETEALWLALIAQTLIHMVFSLNFFQDIYSKLVMLALALWAFHTTASWENLTETEALWLALIAQTLIHMVFSLNFFQDIYSKLVMLALALCALHTIASCENRTEAEALWLALIAQTLIHIMFSLNFFQDIYSKLVTLALCAFHMTASCENRTEMEALWLALIAQTLIHMVFSLNFFQDIYSKLVMLALALCALHTIASCDNRTEAEALCTDFDSLATNCFAVFPGQLTHTHTHLLYFLTCHELWVVGPKQDASNMSNHKCFKVNKRISTESESNSMIWASLNHQDDVQASSNIWASSKS